MAVIVKYIVVRNGEEKMTFATKKEADAYDKMLDIADNLFEFLETFKIELADDQLEKMSFLMAENKDALITILRGSKKAVPPKKKADKSKTKSSEKPDKKPTVKSAKKEKKPKKTKSKK